MLAEDPVEELVAVPVPVRASTCVSRCRCQCWTQWLRTWPVDVLTEDKVSEDRTLVGVRVAELDASDCVAVGVDVREKVLAVERQAVCVRVLELVAEGVGSANGIEVHVLNAVRDCMELAVDDSDCMPAGELFVVAEEL